MLLKLGSRGEEVKTLQMTLKLRGYSIGSSGPDGVFGQDTEKAVKEFQADHNLEPDGIVGPATQEALHHDYSGNTDYGELIKMGSSGPQVAEMQRLLIKAGFSVGPAGADGIFGEGTYEAVRRFQESRGLAKDGIIGPDTKNALKGTSGSSSKLLKLGSRGTEVKELQRLLINTGYSIGSAGADGVFGAGTESAVKRFQSAKGLDSDGIVGPATWSALKGGTSSELLKLGSRGESVREAQNLLIKAGFSVGSYGADGVFGQGTYEAVKRFQGSKGLDKDGIIGPATWSALRGGSVESGLLRLGSRGESVRQLQELLIKAGYSVGSYGADGVFGAGTESAVKRFQSAKGLAKDGIVGPATWGALYGSGGNTVHVSGGPGVLKFVGVAEAQEFHERIINSKGEGDNMTPYGAWYGMNGVPWCAIFVSWCANQAGILGSVVPRYHYCANAVNWYRSMGRYRTRQSGYTPKAGDVIFFYDASESAPFCHTGIVTGYENGEVITTEGNARQAVRHNLRYSRNYWKIHGYGDNGGVGNGLSQSDLDKINNNKLSRLLGVNFNFETKEKVFINSKYFKISYQYSNKINIGDGEGFSFEYKNGKFEGSTMATGIANLVLALGKASTSFENTMSLFDGLDLTISAGIDEGKAKVSIKTTQKLNNNDSVELILNIIFKMTKDDIIDSIKKEVSDIVNLLYDNLGIIGIAIFIIGFIAFIVVSDGTGALATPAAVSAIAAVLLAKKI